MENVNEDGNAAAGDEDNIIMAACAELIRVPPIQNIRLMKGENEKELSMIEYACMEDAYDAADHSAVLDSADRVQSSDDAKAAGMIPSGSSSGAAAFDRPTKSLFPNCKWIKERYGSKNKDPICKRKSKLCKKKLALLKGIKIAAGSNCARFPLIISVVAQV